MEYSEVKNRVLKPFADFIHELKQKQINSSIMLSIYPDGFFYHQTKKLAESNLPLIDAKLLLKDYCKHPEAIQDFNHKTNSLIEIYNRMLAEPEYQNIYPDLDNIINYLRGLIAEKPKGKPCISVNRAKALCLIKAYQDGLIDTATWTSKPKFKKLVADTVKGSYKVYTESRNAYLWDERDKHPEDFKHALELYNKHFKKPG